MNRHLERWIVAHRFAPVDDVFVWLTRIGSWGYVWLALGLAVALARRRLRPFVLVLLADAAAEGLGDGIKVAVGEQRPHVPGSSRSRSRPRSRPRTPRRASRARPVLSALVPRAAPGFFALATAIAYSRLYVGVHWPLDVVAGAALGVATALLLLGASRRRSRGAPRRG
ncbi:MAG: phosphatase PAP2 family protein [Acidobacteriota bacterium]|nr:phosphatase PAP2 family protein [Acidobacteriota bacterium]